MFKIGDKTLRNEECKLATTYQCLVIGFKGYTEDIGAICIVLEWETITSSHLTCIY